MKLLIRPIFLLFTLMTIPTVYSMQVEDQEPVTEERTFLLLPKELLDYMLLMKLYKYPWDNLVHIIKLRGVCSRWYAVIPDVKGMALKLGIPPFNLATMMNDVTEMIRLKLNHKQFFHEQDEEEYRPTHYALATQSLDALRMLKIGRVENMYFWFDENVYENIVSFMEKVRNLSPDDTLDAQTQNVIDSLDIYEKEYSVSEIQAAAESADVGRLEKMLANLKDPLILCSLDFEKFGQEKLPCEQSKGLQRILLAISGYLERLLFFYLRAGDEVPEDFFEKFGRFDADPNAINDSGMSLLQVMCFSDTVSEKTFSELLACEGINVNYVPRNQDSLSVLHCAVMGGKSYAIEKILATGKCNPDPAGTDGRTPLHDAIGLDKLEAVKLLIKYGADVNRQSKEGFSALHYAAQYGCAEVLQALLDTDRCNLELQDCQEHTPLVIAVQNDQVDCMCRLIQKGANMYRRGKLGDSLFHCAVANSSVRALKVLIQKSPRNINTPNNLGFGITPMHLAAHKGFLKCMELLIDGEAIIDVCNAEDETPLHYAASRGHLLCVKLLIERGAAIDRTTSKDLKNQGGLFGGYTALHFAAHKGHCEVVKMLVEHNADWSKETTFGKTAYDLAKEYNHTTIVEYLESLQKTTF